MRLHRLAPLCLGLIAVLFAGCGGDDGGRDTSAQAKAFCAVAEPVKKLSGVLESEDPKAIEAAFTSAETALNAVAGDPPKDIATDIATIKTHFSAANDALKKAGYNLDNLADATAGKAVTDLEDASFTKAGDNVQAWTTKNCT
jgi:hypothetical protein